MKKLMWLWFLLLGVFAAPSFAAISLLGETATTLGGAPASYTPAVGSYLVVVAVAQTSDVTAVSDGTNTYTKQGPSYSAGTGWFMTVWTSSKITASASYTISMTTAGSLPSIFVGEIGGSSGYQTSVGQGQLTPGAGTDAVSSGVTGVLSAQPALHYSVCLTLGSATPSSHGTGFTTGTASGWSGFGASEWKRVTATTSIAATWTNSTGGTSNFLTMDAVFTEPAAAGGMFLTFP